MFIPSIFFRVDEIKRMMEEYGDVRDVYIPQDFHTHRPRCANDKYDVGSDAFLPICTTTILQNILSINYTILHVDLHNRGFAFVEFYNAGDAAEAHDKLNHAKLAGREIAIVFAKDKRKTPGEMRGGRDMGSRGGGDRGGMITNLSKTFYRRRI